MIWNTKTIVCRTLYLDSVPRRRKSPTRRVFRISGWGNLTLHASPGSSLKSNTKDWPSVKITLSDPKTPTRSLGPCDVCVYVWKKVCEREGRRECVYMCVVWKKKIWQELLWYCNRMDIMFFKTWVSLSLYWLMYAQNVNMLSWRL